MALIRCPECDKEISDKARKCPHCGYPIKLPIPDRDVDIQQPSVEPVRKKVVREQTSLDESASQRWQQTIKPYSSKPARRRSTSLSHRLLRSRNFVRPFIIITLIFVVLLSSFLLYNCSKSPERVVMRSFELLRSGDILNLEQCYTPEAWQYFSPFLANFSSEETDSLKNYMKNVSDVKVVKVEKLPDKVKVTVQVKTNSGDSEMQSFVLTKYIDGTWRIN